MIASSLARRRGLAYPSTRRRRVIPLETEERFQTRVEALAGALGWALAYHTRNSKGSAPGFPDLVLCREPRVLFIELKTEHGVLTDWQKAWAYGLSHSPGVEYYLFRPSDWDLVVRVLSRRAT